MNGLLLTQTLEHTVGLAVINKTDKCENTGLFLFFYGMAINELIFLAVAGRILVPQAGIKGAPWQMKCRVLTTDCQGSPRTVILDMTQVTVTSWNRNCCE